MEGAGLMLVYVVHRTGGVVGSSKSAEDVFRVLVGMGRPLTIVSHSQCVGLRQLTKQRGVAATWLSPPRGVSFPATLDRRLPRRLASWAKNGVLDVFRRRKLPVLDQGRLAVVNSLGSHSLWESAAEAFSGPTALIVRESPRNFTFPSSPYPLEWAVAALSTYSFLLFVSSRGRDEWLAMESLRGKPSFHVPNCCDEEQVSALLQQDRTAVRRELGFPADRFVAVCVASIQFRKGQDILLDVFPDLLGAIPHLCLSLVGPARGPWGDQVLRRLGEQSFAGRAVARGPRPDALKYIHAADCLVLPSRAEAMPRVILEAMALGTPVVASDVDGIPEMIEHDVNGLLFSPDRPQGLVEALAKIAGDPQAAATMADRARERYWANFSRAHLVKRYRNVFEELLGRVGAPGEGQENKDE